MEPKCGKNGKMAKWQNGKMAKIERAQNAALSIITFSDFKAHSAPIFQELKILKFQDNIQLQHILLVHDFKNKMLPKSFNDFFIDTDRAWVHTRTESQAVTELIHASAYNQVKYGRKYITQASVNIWNKFANHIFPDVNLSLISRQKMKYVVSKYFLDSYTLIDD